MSEPTKIEWDAAEAIDDALSNCPEGETVNFSEMARIIYEHTGPLHAAGERLVKVMREAMDAPNCCPSCTDSYLSAIAA